MSTSSSSTPGLEPVKTSIAPWLSVSQATEAVAYYKAVFDAVERYRLEDDAGQVAITQLAIGDADFWLQQDVDSSPEGHSRQAVRMILTVNDPDAVFAQAIAAGATSVAAVSEEHGWRIGRLTDPCGHEWEIGKPLR